MDDFDADVLEALVAERARPSPVGLDGKQRVLQRVAFSALGVAAAGAIASLAVSNAGPSLPAAAESAAGASRVASRVVEATWLKLVVVSLVAFAGGAGTHAIYTNRADPVTHVSSPALVTASLPSSSVDLPVDRPPASSTAVPVVAVSSLPEAPRAVPSSSPSPASSSSVAKDEPTQLRLRERSMLEAAQSALARGDFGEALSLVERHAREFPKSELGEEREALRIRALARGGRCDEAKSARTAFVTRFPASLQRGALERLCPPAVP